MTASAADNRKYIRKTTLPLHYPPQGFCSCDHLHINHSLCTKLTQEIYDAVQVRYGNIAKQSHDTQQFRNPNSVEDSLARAFGYSSEDLVSLPEKANLGVSCGNPVAVAGIKEVRIPTNVSLRLLEKNLKKPDSEDIVAWLNSCCGVAKESVRLPAGEFADVDFNAWVGESYLFLTL
jgi:hypothetical protein